VNGLELKVGGSLYGGWKSVRVQRGIEQIAGAFTLGVTEKWEGTPTPRPIHPGEPCQVLMDGEPVITGYVDEPSPDYDANSHGISVEGRDKTADLVDCSAIHKSGQWKGRTLAQIARDLCRPFGIKVIEEVSVSESFSSFNIQEGETVFECLDRAARMRGVLLMADGLGNLVITRSGREKSGAALEEGVNILRARGSFSHRERFSNYIVKGHGREDDDNFGETVTGASGEARDDAITRYRPLIVLAEEGEHTSFRRRAEWERNVRRGRGSRATVTVRGWRRADGSLWTPNTRVNLKSPLIHADFEVLIVSCTYTLDDSGTLTELELARPEAFELLEGVKGTRLSTAIKGKNGAAHNVAGAKKAMKEEWK
jgi:prophage tail gpP-like protein